MIRFLRHKIPNLPNGIIAGVYNYSAIDQCVADVVPVPDVLDQQSAAVPLEVCEQDAKTIDVVQAITIHVGMRAQELDVDRLAYALRLFTGQNKRIIIVAHSDGNHVVQAALSQLADAGDGIPIDPIGVIMLGSPVAESQMPVSSTTHVKWIGNVDDYVARIGAVEQGCPEQAASAKETLRHALVALGEGRHLTHAEIDDMLAAIDQFADRMAYDACGVELYTNESTHRRGHDFVWSYLEGQQTGPEVVSAIEGLIQALPLPSEVHDSDGDGVPDDQDGCKDDPDKTSPGNCGCGEPETPDCGDTGGGTFSGETATLDLGGGVTMELVRIPAGTFMMGSYNGLSNETPVHAVTISNDFYIGRYEVTQAQWRAVMDDNPSHFSGCDDCPVETVSWNDAVAFCDALSASSGYDIRLPSEAEWEYACRAGTTTEYYFGDHPASLDDYAWHSQNSGSRTYPVGGKLSNAWGLYDMSGNVWEWCYDRHGSSYYDSYPPGGWPPNPTGPQDGTNRVIRGGSWNSGISHARSANRDGHPSATADISIGFRCASGTP